MLRNMIIPFKKSDNAKTILGSVTFAMQCGHWPTFQQKINKIEMHFTVLM